MRSSSACRSCASSAKRRRLRGGCPCARGRGDLGSIDVDALFAMLQAVDEMDQLDEGAFEKAPEEKVEA